MINITIGSREETRNWAEKIRKKTNKGINYVGIRIQENLFASIIVEENDHLLEQMIVSQGIIDRLRLVEKVSE